MKNTNMNMQNYIVTSINFEITSELFDPSNF